MKTMKSEKREMVEKMYRLKFGEDSLYYVMEQRIFAILDPNVEKHAIQECAKTWTNHVLNRIDIVRTESHVTMTVIKNEMPFYSSTSYGTEEACKGLIGKIVNSVWKYMLDTRELDETIQELRSAGVISGPKFDAVNLRYKYWIQDGVMLKRYAKNLDSYINTISKKASTSK